ncbi:phospholipase D-like domain-containing protein [Halobaculum gomorrense]|uniref:Phosphatidylserine/phosphatidylglycerophosphate/cardiolipin synthase n=1 Tax=Halobaculum gomorrense TaxID=43928 RepID=A0A1M5SF55_9EURY|nr:phospholipase D-like domain-containing protein [Halobaculum gomorrense]SHH37060.1 Phosphatidylserine/phosphatidylglycerophosphate/cardiolipin synthase [Halobaculum gomorrense]
MQRFLGVVASVLVLVAAATPAAVATAAVEDPKPATNATRAGATADTDTGATADTAREATGATAPRIVALLANPVATDDAGEYLLLSLPPGNWSVGDGEGAVAIEQRRAGPVVATADPEALVAPPAGRVVPRGLRLSNAGERVVLRRGGENGSVVDAVEYGRAPEGERWERAAGGDDVGGSRWRPVGLAHRDPLALGSADATAFVLPDTPAAPLTTIRSADERVLLAGYTFGSRRVARELIAARERGATVRVLLEGGPVGGVSARQAALLDSLAAAGIDVRVLAGPHARFRYHHAKYAVADDTAVVLTENWKPSGTGGADSRGWGVELRSPRAADALADLFRADAGWRDAVPWSRYRTGRPFEEVDPATGSYPARHAPADVHVKRVRLLTAPGNARAAVVEVVDDAEATVDVIQPTVERGPMVASLRRAARRGVRVRLLLSNAWYVADENAALAASLNSWAADAGVPLEARVAEPAGRYGKIHAKGVVADDVALVGSLNWNPTSARENREVVIALEGEDVADYYRGTFAADWRAGTGGSGDLPPGFAIGAVGAVAGAVLFVRRRLSFDDASEGRRGPIG